MLENKDPCILFYPFDQSGQPPSQAGGARKALEKRCVLYLAWKSVWGYRFRAILTMLGVALGTFAFTTMGAMASHFHQMAKRFEFYVEGKLFIRERSGFFGAGAIDEEELLAVARIPGVREVIPVVVSRLRTRELFVLGLPQIALGLPPDQIGLLFRGVPLLRGTWPERPGECVLGIDVAASAGGIQTATFMYEKRRLRVSGIMARTNGQEDNQMVLPLSTLKEILGRKGLVSYGIVLPEPWIPPDRLAFQIERRHPLWEALPSEVVMREVRKNEKLWYALTLGIGILAVLVGGMGILTVMLLAVNERTREIAVAKSLGASRAQIFAQYALEAFLLALLGSFLGFLAGAWFVSEANRYLSKQGMILFALEARHLGSAFLLTFFLSLVGGLFPAAAGARIRVAEGLRS